MAFVSIAIFLCLLNARHAAAWTNKVLEGSRKESSRYLRVKGGRVVYQFTICVKLPEVAFGSKYGF
ncbi:MAG: hypothetical protein GQ533_03275 [Methanosarcinaceae archaeon]|nr:hypothetical protein [Methanosarcinaceae archaeon]